MVKISATYDEQGNITAASEPGAEADQPVPSNHERVAEFDVPDEAAELGIGEICRRYQVDVDTTALTRR